MARNVTGTETYTNGPYVRPSNNDKGDVVFPLLESIIERLATHSHSGADSNRISLNIEKDVEDLIGGVTLLWVDQGNDTFRAPVAVPAGASYAGSIRKFYLKRAGNFVEFYPTTEYVDDNNYFVIANEALTDLRVVTL
jgi:hypothetical protein